MARTPVTPTTATGIASNGHNLTDATFSTLTSGSGNGVSVTVSYNTVIFLKNDTGSSAVYTLVLPDISAITSLGGSVNNPSITVANGKTHVFRPPDALKNSDDTVNIDCSVAGKLLALNI